MKSSFSYQNQLSSVSQHKKMLDVVIREKSIRRATDQVADVTSPRKNIVSDMYTKKETPRTTSQRGGFDGIRTEKQAFLKQLKTRSTKDILWQFFRKGEMYYRRVKRTITRFTPSIAPHKMLYGSLIGGVAFGVISMGFIEHFFGPGVFARSADVSPVVAIATPEVVSVPQENADVSQSDYNAGSDIFFEYFNEAADGKYKENVREMVKGYPIEAMLPYIFEQDRMTAAFLIGIAKKESNWGKRIPVLADQDCFNYWGYRGIRRMMGTGGHTCFNSRKDAVETVAKRLNTLIHSEKLNTPEKMIIWKCGFSCSGHSRESVKKWISDVDMYFSQVDQE